MGLDPAKPEMTLLLVMLHTGTMFAMIVYFWRAWKSSIFASRGVFTQQAVRLITATMLTVAVGYPIIKGIEKGLEKSGYLVKDAGGHVPRAEIELLFGNLGLVAGALLAVGALILIAGLAERATARNREIGIREAAWIGVVQGLSIPFRGFSRSGATISTGLLLGAWQGAAGGIQLRPGSHPHPRGRGVGGLAEHQQNRAFRRDMEHVRSQPVGHGLRLSRRFARPEMALALARGRALASLRHLLPGGCVRSIRPPLLRLLILRPRAQKKREQGRRFAPLVP